MDDRCFLETLNRLSRERNLMLGRLGSGSEISVEEMDRWATFLGWCMNEGISLADARWQQVRVAPAGGHSEFHLQVSEPVGHDSNFRVGLQLLIGVLTGYEEARAEKEGE